MNKKYRLLQETGLHLERIREIMEEEKKGETFPYNEELKKVSRRLGMARIRYRKFRKFVEEKFPEVLCRMEEEERKRKDRSNARLMAFYEETIMKAVKV